MDVSLGGATLNSIRVAQWMLQIPGSTAYFGAIGEDKFGETLGKKTISTLSATTEVF
jgi:adenosine kinase